MSELYVQYGCGWSAPDGWLNFDGSPTLYFERIPLLGQLYTKNANRFPKAVRYGDVVAGLPIAERSCDAIYCSHVLEHLALDDADTALRNTFNYLKPGGTFRLVMPDLEQLARDYLAAVSSDASHEFMENSFLGKRRRARGIAGFIGDWLGNSAHLWMWDEKSMAARLAQHGFVSIRRARFGDAADPMFNAVEDESRFTGCLAMECKK
ncbi:methyltransferase domain-containing protein [Nevskia sp.]|uniref:class I SAM-dependent methyltransferase n=1 Tax=Nevskia sp. TaxID=1929292 RepID=UPI0025DA06C6|nr:methyltransferase domain-containing protein [Nevskia sp.]